MCYGSSGKVDQGRHLQSKSSSRYTEYGKSINEYYKAAPDRTPMQKALDIDNFGIRPGTKVKVYKMTPAEEEAEIKALEANADSEAQYAAEIDQLQMSILDCPPWIGLS